MCPWLKWCLHTQPAGSLYSKSPFSALNEKPGSWKTVEEVQMENLEEEEVRSSATEHRLTSCSQNTPLYHKNEREKVHRTCNLTTSVWRHLRWLGIQCMMTTFDTYHIMLFLSFDHSLSLYEKKNLLLSSTEERMSYKVWKDMIVKKLQKMYL